MHSLLIVVVTLTFNVHEMFHLKYHNYVIEFVNINCYFSWKGVSLFQ